MERSDDFTIRSARRARIVQKILIYAALIILALIMAYPLFCILNISLKNNGNALRDPLSLTSFAEMHFENYVSVWQRMKVSQKIWNSLWMTIVSCTINIAISVLAAFPISRKYFRGAEKAYLFILLSMFFPGSLVATIYLMQNVFHVYGSPLALIILWGFGGTQMNIFMVVGFLKQLPKDLDEAAFIDGCGYLRYVMTMAMPLMMPIVSTLFTFKAIGCWNDFLGPMIYLKGDVFRPLSTGLYFYLNGLTSRWNLFSSAIVLVAAPMIVLYLFMQKYIIAGMVSGALKG